MTTHDTLEDDAIIRVAKAAHEVNRAYCESMGDDSQPSWEEAPDWQKESAVNGVKHVMKCEVEGKRPLPHESHENWLKQKEEEGWEYGPVKDPENKLHPCMVPYDELPVEQRAKDYLFIAVVQQALELVKSGK